MTDLRTSATTDPDQPPARHVRPIAVLAEVNARIRELASRNDPTGDRRWAFICECGEAACLDHVEATLEEFDELRAAGGSVLARCHGGQVPL